MEPSTGPSIYKWLTVYTKTRNHSFLLPDDYLQSAPYSTLPLTLANLAPCASLSDLWIAGIPHQINTVHLIPILPYPCMWLLQCLSCLHSLWIPVRFQRQSHAGGAQAGRSSNRQANKILRSSMTTEWYSCITPGFTTKGLQVCTQQC